MDLQTIDHGSGYAWDRNFFDGHFPGNPIVPGAVLLAQASSDLAAQGQRITQVIRMKFIRPLGPEHPFQINFTPAGDNWRIDFTDTQGPIARAAVKLEHLND